MAYIERKRSSAKELQQGEKKKEIMIEEH